MPNFFKTVSPGGAEAEAVDAEDLAFGADVFPPESGDVFLFVCPFVLSSSTA
jgi:hypothetical protein